MSEITFGHKTLLSEVLVGWATSGDSEVACVDDVVNRIAEARAQLKIPSSAS